MLIEFSVGNYRSFKDPVTFSMVAANLVSKDKNLDANNVVNIDKDLKLLRASAIYGANASGKSNLVKALAFMKWFMVNSSKETQSTDRIHIEPFRLSTETEGKPSFFQLAFLMDGKKYRYGFEVTPERVISEWLYYVPNLREAKLFERDYDTIKSSKVYKGSDLYKVTRSNALFLSVSAQFNVDIAQGILEWITANVNIISGLYDHFHQDFTINCLTGNYHKADIIQFVKTLDLGINDIKIEQDDFPLESLPEQMPESLKKIISEAEDMKWTSIQTSHQKFDPDGNLKSIEIFDMSEHESQGTQKLFALAGLIIAILKEGGIMMIDEFDARLHPLISHEIIKLFHNSQTNPQGAQLIFVTHDTNLLSGKLFRRDQIWFTEKNRYGATDLYSLAEYKIRNDASFESDYIKGRYGAIPYIGNLHQILESND